MSWERDVWYVFSLTFFCKQLLYICVWTKWILIFWGSWLVFFLFFFAQEVYLYVLFVLQRVFGGLLLILMDFLITFLNWKFYDSNFTFEFCFTKLQFYFTFWFTFFIFVHLYKSWESVFGFNCLFNCTVNDIFIECVAFAVAKVQYAIYGTMIVIIYWRVLRWS